MYIYSQTYNGSQQAVVIFASAQKLISHTGNDRHVSQRTRVHKFGGVAAFRLVQRCSEFQWISGLWPSPGSWLSWLSCIARPGCYCYATDGGGSFSVDDFSHLLASPAGGSAHIIHCHGTRCWEPENMPQVVLEVVWWRGSMLYQAVPS